jgi:GntR family transcriptional regulator
VQPKHEQLADVLRDRLDLSIYPGGSRLPTEADLMTEFGVSRTTVRNALLNLQNEGRLRAESGVGYFVPQQRRYQHRPQDDFRRFELRRDRGGDSFEQSPTAAGHNPTQRIEVSIVPAPVGVARRLKLPVGEFVVLRSRLRLLDDDRGVSVPYQLNDSYYPRHVVEGSAAMRPGSVEPGVNELLAERGFAQVRAFDEVYVRMPSRQEAERLQIPRGVPIAEYIITGLTATDEPVRTVRIILPGDRNVITFDRTHPDYEDAPRGD